MELLILLVGAFLGGMMAWAIKVSASKMKLILAFSGAFMLGLCFFHVLPESYEAVGSQAGIWVLAGFMVQIMLEVLSKGMEHGHAHALHGKQLPLALFIGLGSRTIVCPNFAIAIRRRLVWAIVTLFRILPIVW